MNTTSPITVILADDHELLREGFKSSFQKMGIKVLATAKDGGELLQLLKSTWRIFL
jgi:DNA-binding NarL/FixJ family response regulator